MLKYAFSLEHISELSEDFLKEIYVNYKGIELSSEHIINRENRQHISFISKYMDMVDIINVMSKNISRNIQFQNNYIQNNCINQIDDILSQLNKFNLNINSFPMYFSEKETDSTLNFIKKLYPLLSYYDKKLLLPVRLPFTKENIDKYYSNLLTQVMHPNILVSLNINPHEISRDFDMYKELNLLNYHIAKVRIIYEPNIGNYITTHILEKIFNYLSKIGYNDYVFFVPKVSKHKIFIEESIKIKKILKKIAFKFDEWYFKE